MAPRRPPIRTFRPAPDAFLAPAPLARSLLSHRDVTATGTLVEVTIKLFASFRAGRFEVEKRACRPGTTVDDLVRELGIPHEEVGVILVRGRHAAFEHVAAAGDTIAIFPLLGGG
jgi:molybdopterin converting factor small subunit